MYFVSLYCGSAAFISVGNVFGLSHIAVSHFSPKSMMTCTSIKFHIVSDCKLQLDCICVKAPVEPEALDVSTG